MTMTENTRQAGAATSLNRDARAAMEAMNTEAALLNIWLRTQANAPARKAWFKHTGLHDTGHEKGVVKKVSDLFREIRCK